MKLGPWHHKRTQITDENLLQYIDDIRLSERTKKIVQDYVDGDSYKTLGEKYNLAYNRIPQIVALI